MSHSRFKWAQVSLLGVAFVMGCGKSPRAPVSVEDSGPACEARQRDLTSLLARLPERAMVSSLAVELPEARIGELPGGGPVLEIAEKEARFDGQPLGGADAAERAKALEARLDAKRTDGARGADDKPRTLTVYVAVQRQLDVQTVRTYLSRVPDGIGLRLLLRVPAPPAPGASAPSEKRSATAELAERLLAERDPSVREELAREGYAQSARCSKVQAAVSGVRGVGPEQRWPRLRESLLAALPSCACGELDTEGLEQLLVAEQRAGTATLGALPLGFIRDERCGASMPLRSFAKLIQQMESFDEEFSGGWQQDALAFERVLTDDRLLNYFCNALPGETLAALERARATLYWKVAGADACEAWRFEPLAPGAPMGTFRRVAAASGGAGLAFHYWQAAEEIRLFGPLDPRAPSKPTDRRDWACDNNQRLTGVDGHSLAFERGRWFFDAAACRAAGPGEAFGGCAAERSASP
jgi:hypothetical protein